MAGRTKNQSEEVIFTPQEGPQTEFLSSSADIVIYGGEAGGGKTYGLLGESVRFSKDPNMTCVILQRTSTQLKQGGGIWDESFKFFLKFEPKAKPNLNTLYWKFPSGMKIEFSSMQYEHDKYSYDGSQIPVICFDELQHFTEGQFFYMLSRNRSGSCKGIKPYIRATCNPAPGSWLKNLIRWWLDEEGRYADKSKSGIIRYFIRDDNLVIWADTKEELLDKFPGCTPISLTFIHASLSDNKKLIENDPDYKSKLDALPMYERERLKGDWKIEAGGGNIFKPEWIPVVYYPPEENKIISICRYWDRASKKPTKENPRPDWTVGFLLARTIKDIYFGLDVVRFQGGSLEVQETIKRTSKQDYQQYREKYFVALEQDPGSAGVSEIETLTRLLAGFPIKIFKPTQDKIKRASPYAAQCEAGNIFLLNGIWNEAYLEELKMFPDGSNDDQIDASGGAFLAVALNPAGQLNQIKVKDTIKTYGDKYR